MGKTVAAQNSTLMQNSRDKPAKASPQHKQRGKDKKKENYALQKLPTSISLGRVQFFFFNAENSYRKNHGKFMITPLAGENVTRKRYISKWPITDFAPTKFFYDG